MIDGIRIVMLRDIRTFITNFYGVGFRTLQVTLQTVIFAYILAAVVSTSLIGGLSYLQYYALGALVISIFWASYSIGRDVYWDRETGYLNYLMSLPLSREEIIIGRSIGGSARGVITVLPLYALAAVLVPTTAVNLIESVALLFCFGVGLCGLGIIVSLSVREEVKARLLNTFLSLALVRASTAMYPAVAMPVWLQLGTKLNPVSYAADSIRTVTQFSPLAAIPTEDISIVLVFTALAALLGSWLFARAIEGGPAE